MLTHAPTLSFTRTVTAPAADVYRAFLAPQALRDWLCDVAHINAWPGGPVHFWWEDGYYTAGTITDLAHDERLAFTWQGPGEPPAIVRVDLAPRGAQTTVRVTYDGGATDSALEARVAQLWEAALENLQSLLETGVDLRAARRPMFGITGGDTLTAAQAVELGVPVTEGLRLDGVVENLGAHVAGLQRDDVIVALGGAPVAGLPSLYAALQEHQAGDVVPVTFYRGAEQRVVPVELSRRPLPEPPASLEALLTLAREVYATADAELAACLAGVGEATVDYRPAPEAWTVKEIVAHLIAIELDVQTWLAIIIEDGHAEWPFHANTTQRGRALVRAYPTLAELIELLRRSVTTNLALMELLPPEPVRRYQLNHLAAHLREGQVDHVREHIADIEALQQAAARAGVMDGGTTHGR
jgi:uncharacterized protein YndB with AHSA1/START domain